MSGPPVLLVGGSPSSGSTLLMNQLARSPGVACLPETGLFAHGRNLVDLSAPFEDRGLDWHVPWLDTAAKVTNALGWNPNVYGNAAETYATTMDLLVDQINRDGHAWIVEKTPENIFAFDKFLSLSADNVVVVTSRDLVGVVHSLVRRRFTIAEALLAWFSHSYETARVLAAYPSQVVHCRFAELTSDTEGVLRSILTLIHRQQGIDSPAASDEPPSQLTRMLDVSGWKLGDTSWTHSANEPVRSIEPVNMIGLPLDVLVDTVAFETTHHGLVRPRAIDEVLAGTTASISTVQDESISVKLTQSNAYTQSLARHFPMRRLGRARC